MNLEQRKFNKNYWTGFKVEESKKKCGKWKRMNKRYGGHIKKIQHIPALISK